MSHFLTIAAALTILLLPPVQALSESPGPGLGASDGSSVQVDYESNDTLSPGDDEATLAYQFGPAKLRANPGVNASLEGGEVVLETPTWPLIAAIDTTTDTIVLESVRDRLDLYADPSGFKLHRDLPFAGNNRADRPTPYPTGDYQRTYLPLYTSTGDSDWYVHLVNESYSRCKGEPIARVCPSLLIEFPEDGLTVLLPRIRNISYKFEGVIIEREQPREQLDSDRFQSVDEDGATNESSVGAQDEAQLGEWGVASHGVAPSSHDGARSSKKELRKNLPAPQQAVENQWTTIIVIVGLAAPLAALLYHRLRKEAVMGQESRARILSIIGKTPGVNLNWLARALEKDPRTVAYHVRYLLDVGAIKVVRIGREIVCLPPGAKREHALVSRTADPLNIIVVSMAASRGGATLKDLSERLGLTRQAVARRANRLASIGLVTVAKEGKRIVVSAG